MTTTTIIIIIIIIIIVKRCCCLEEIFCGKGRHCNTDSTIVSDAAVFLPYLLAS
jgi:hypothetical protein